MDKKRLEAIMEIKIRILNRFEDRYQLATALKDKRKNEHYRSVFGSRYNPRYKFSQQYVADKLGISRVMYQNYENAKVDPLKMSDDLFEKMYSWLGLINQEKFENQVCTISSRE